MLKLSPFALKIDSKTPANKTSAENKPVIWFLSLQVKFDPAVVFTKKYSNRFSFECLFQLMHSNSRNSKHETTNLIRASFLYNNNKQLSDDT